MKKTILMTSEESFINNYGAALQGYALFTTLKKNGCDVKIVKYKGGEFELNYKKETFFFVKRFFGNVKRKFLTFNNSSIERKYKKEIANRTKRFEKFIGENFVFWNKKRVIWNQLRKKFPIADIYVCGSDQIWNPYFKGERNNPGYFLYFAPSNAKKIAYAPSFGCNDLPLKSQKTLRELLKNFNAISVREASGVQIVKKYANRDALHVVDPTFLLEPNEWIDFSRFPNNVPDKYILCYRFSNNNRTLKKIIEISKITGLPVVSLPLANFSYNDPFIKMFDAGPREFVGLINNASLVCTDSFHATVFSIISKTPVAVFLRESFSDGQNMNSRVYNLLDNLNLTYLIDKDEDLFSYLDNIKKVDYENAHEILKLKRKESLKFLVDALNE